MSAEKIAHLMLCAAYHPHAAAQGADGQAEGWTERAHRSFQRAVAGFRVETCDAEIAEAGDVLLPYLSGPNEPQPDSTGC